MKPTKKKVPMQSYEEFLVDKVKEAERENAVLRCGLDAYRYVLGIELSHFLDSTTNKKVEIEKCINDESGEFEIGNVIPPEVKNAIDKKIFEMEKKRKAKQEVMYA